MKKVYLFICCLISLLINAQNLSFSEEEIYLEFGEDMDYHDVTIYNTSDVDAELGFTLETLCYPLGDNTKFVLHFATFHLFPTCETTTWDETLMTVPAQDSSSLIRLEQYTGSFGTTWNLIVFDVNNPTDADTLYIQIEEECLVSNNNLLNDISIGKAYPNPSTNRCIIELNVPSTSKLIIHNSTGKEVKNIFIEEGETEVILNTEQFNEGVYFYYVTKDKKISKVQTFFVVKE